MLSKTVWFSTIATYVCTIGVICMCNTEYANAKCLKWHVLSLKDRVPHCMLSLVIRVQSVPVISQIVENPH